MSSDIEQRALDLLAEEDNRNREIAARRAEQEREGRFQDAIRRVKEQDRELRMEQARIEAAAEAEALAQARAELEERIEAEARQLSDSLAELQSLHAEHTDALRKVGRPLDYGFRLFDIVTGWWRHRFGGFNSLTGTPSPFHGAQDLPLCERDPLAVTSPDGQEG